MLDKDANTKDHTCQVCGEVQFEREVDIDKTLDRVHALVAAFVEAGGKVLPDAQTGEILTALSLLANMIAHASPVLKEMKPDGRESLAKSWQAAFGDIEGFPNPFKEVNK